MTWDSRLPRIHMICVTITCEETTQLVSTRIDDNMQKKTYTEKKSLCSLLSQNILLPKARTNHVSMKEHMRRRARQHQQREIPSTFSPVAELATKSRDIISICQWHFLSHLITTSVLIPQYKNTVVVTPKFRSSDHWKHSCLRAQGDLRTGNRKTYVIQYDWMITFSSFFDRIRRKKHRIRSEDLGRVKIEEPSQDFLLHNPQFRPLLSRHLKTSRTVRTPRTHWKKPLTKRMKRKKWTIDDSPAKQVEQVSFLKHPPWSDRLTAR